MSQQTINIPDGFELVQTSETTFEIKKKQKQFPKTWEEFCKINSIIKEGKSYITNVSEVASMHTCCPRKLLKKIYSQQRKMQKVFLH